MKGWNAQCLIWYATVCLHLSNCVFCVRRASCAHQKLVRIMAKGLFVVSGLRKESTGRGFHSPGVSCQGWVKCPGHSPLSVCFPEASIYFAPGGISQQWTCGVGGRFFSNPSRIWESLTHSFCRGLSSVKAEVSGLTGTQLTCKFLAGDTCATIITLTIKYNKFSLKPLVLKQTNKQIPKP